MDQALKVKIEMAESNIEMIINSLEVFTGLEVKDIGLMRNAKGKLKALIVLWRGKDAKIKEG